MKYVKILLATSLSMFLCSCMQGTSGTASTSAGVGVASSGSMPSAQAGRSILLRNQQTASSDPLRTGRTPTMGRAFLNQLEDEESGYAYYTYLLIPSKAPHLRERIDAALCAFARTPTLERVEQIEKGNRDSISLFLLPVESKPQNTQSASALFSAYDFARADHLLKDLALHSNTGISGNQVISGIHLIAYREPLFLKQKESKLPGIDKRLLFWKSLEHLNAREIETVINFVRHYPNPKDYARHRDWGKDPYPNPIIYMRATFDAVGEGVIRLAEYLRVGTAQALPAAPPQPDGCGTS